MIYSDNVKMDGYRYCPECNSDFKGVAIPENYRQAGYYGSDPDTHYSRLIGIETPGYDGISLWRCPDCSHTWKRFKK